MSDPYVAATKSGFWDRSAKRLRTIADTVPNLREEQLQASPTSPEAAQLVRQLYIHRTDGRALPSDVKRQFVVCFANSLGVSPDRIQPHAGHVFDAFVLAINRALEIARKYGEQGAKEPILNLRHGQIDEHPVSLENNLALLAGGQAEIREILTFEEAYQTQAPRREAVVRPEPAG
jgi:hypothetical protein